METIISCCGMVCSACEYYPVDCKGCPAIQGKAFWLQYTGEAVCAIYQCCMHEKGYAHCGECADLPCAHYTEGDGDPTKTAEENAAILAKQVAQLRNL